jgi:hypothetical protein
MGAILPIEAILGSNSAATAFANTDSVDNVALLGFVAEAARFIGAGRMSQADKLGELAIFPGSEAKKVTKNIALLLRPQFAKIGICTHQKGKPR